jgi:hypothetical protein
MDSQWHDDVEGARTAEEAVECVRRAIGALKAQDPALAPIFDLVVHASLRIEHLNRAQAAGYTGFPQMRQMG